MNHHPTGMNTRALKVAAIWQPDAGTGAEQFHKKDLAPRRADLFLIRCQLLALDTGG